MANYIKSVGLLFCHVIAATLCVNAIATAQVSSSEQQLRGTFLAPVAVDRYHAAHGGPVWQRNEDYDGLVRAIEGLHEHGLNSEQYQLNELRALRSDLSARDRLASGAWFTAAAHMVFGKLDPRNVEPNWTAAGRGVDFAAMLSRALETGTVESSLSMLAPRQPGYAALKEELTRLRMESVEPIRAISTGPAIRVGERNERVAALQARLRQLNLLSENAQTGTFDNETLVAVETFQTIEELEADGVVGAATIRALNRGPQERIDQVLANLERWRWLPTDLGRRHVRVNIASFEVSTFEGGERVRTHLAIVGKPYRKTPVFSDEIEYIDLNPWWEVPPNLARADKIPQFQRDPEAVRRLGFQVLDNSGSMLDPDGIDWNAITPGNFFYRLRQAPGPENALGQVKIMFPNQHNVYLHDTPTRGLFSQRQRAFSSGCVRTQDPLDLAAWLLEETPDWDQSRIDAAVSSGRNTRVNLSSRVPVHILYSTVVSDGIGGVRYLDDIYERDQAVLAGLRS